MAAFDPRFDLNRNVEDTVAVSFTGFPVRSLIRNSSGKGTVMRRIIIMKLMMINLKLVVSGC